jgi:hypothetical protein
LLTLPSNFIPVFWLEPDSSTPTKTPPLPSQTTTTKRGKTQRKKNIKKEKNMHGTQM